MPAFPNTRLRRSRQAPWARRLTQENDLRPHNLILPLFVCEGAKVREPISTLPDCFRLSMDEVVKEALLAQSLGIQAVALFPCVGNDKKDDQGSEALNQNNLMCRTLGMMRDRGVTIGLIADVALDPYTTHGHDGILVGAKVDNDLTVEKLVKQALVLVAAGADVVAPSDMQDGRIGAIRQALEQAGHVETLILAYSAKYASSLYGPFRDAVGSSQTTPIDKSTYQMQPTQIKEALLEAQLDVEEGADWVMVKPGMLYLDVIAHIAQHVSVPTFAYQVSGEYAMLYALSQQTNQPFIPLLHESLVSIRRAGARGILTYGAIEIAQHLVD
ncbi:MAG: porphobilinogen synthase [Gammaproteobacteria bacterium]|nr:porphobilinogen synthase [Gammaproteobacteria bacterium]